MLTKTLIKSLEDEVLRIILELNLISSDVFNKLQQHANNTDDSAYKLAIIDGLISNETFLAALETKYGVGYSLNAKPIIPSSKNFPQKFCIQNGLVPIGEDDVSLVVGVCAPSSLNSLKNLNLLLGKKVSAKFIPMNTLCDFLTPESERVIEQVEALKDQPKEIEVSNVNPSIRENPNKPIAQPNKKKEDGANLKILSGDVVKAVEDILSNAVNTGVSDIHVEIFKDGADVRFRKNGSLMVIKEYEKFINDNYNAVIARIKILANLDIAERRLPQDGKISFTSKSGVSVDFRVSILPTSLGERVVIRVLNSGSLAINVDALGFNEKQKSDFLDAIEAPQGLVLVTGPTGSGKSTTLYGAINYLNKPDVNILTAEDPVEYTLDGISQVQVREDIGLTFASALRSFLRQDPEIILVGEIRDTETADIATKAALTGHLVLSTLHTNSAIGAINRLVNMGLPSYLVSSALTLVVAQRLVRVNCKNCVAEVESHLLSSEEKYINMPELADTKIMQGKGCNACAFTGYSGRRAVHEVLKITPKIQKAIIDKIGEREIANLASEDGFIPMAKAAIQHIKSGELSLEEYFRAIPQYSEEESE